MAVAAVTLFPDNCHQSHHEFWPISARSCGGIAALRKLDVAATWLTEPGFDSTLFLVRGLFLLIVVRMPLALPKAILLL